MPKLIELSANYPLCHTVKYNPPALVSTKLVKFVGPFQDAALRVFDQAELLQPLPGDRDLIDDVYSRALEFDLVGQPYWVETARGVALPKYFKPYDTDLRLIDFYHLSFEARFLRYSKVLIKETVDAPSVQALCLTFDRALLLPDLIPLPRGHVLHVPAPSVEKITPTPGGLDLQ